MHGVPPDNALLVLRRLCEKANSFRLGNIKNDAFTADTLYSKSRGATQRSAQRENIVSEHNIAQPDENVKFSLRDAETDRRCMTAVENGDTETAQRMVDEATEETFKNSEIRQRTEDGEWVFKYFGEGPLAKVHHKTNAEFNVFSMDKLGQNTSTEALEATAYLGLLV